MSILISGSYIKIPKENPQSTSKQAKCYNKPKMGKFYKIF